MSTHDPISDLITRIRNAQMRAKSKVFTPGSKMRQNVLDVLKSEGYIRGYARVEHAPGRNEIEIELKYFDGEPVIREIERISKPGRRVYVAVKNLPRINNGLGVAILSPPQRVNVNGPKGAPELVLRAGVTVKMDKGSIAVDPRDESKQARSQWGTART